MFDRAVPKAGTVSRARTQEHAPCVFPEGLIFRRPPDRWGREPVFAADRGPSLTAKIGLAIGSYAAQEGLSSPYAARCQYPAQTRD